MLRTAAALCGAGAAVLARRAECAVIARQIANAHTLFNVLCALVWLPLTGQMVRLVCALLPDKKRPQERL